MTDSDYELSNEPKMDMYVAPKLLKGLNGPQKRKVAVFRIKSCLFSQKVCYKVSLCDKFQRQSCKAFTGLYLTVHKWLVGSRDPSTWNFRPKWHTPFKNGDFQSIFAGGASTTAAGEKNSIITNRKSTTGFPMSLRWTAYVAPKP